MAQTHDRSAAVPTPDASPPSQAGGEILPVGGGYRLFKPLGRGAFGEVWRAEAPGGVAVAVKIVARSVTGAEAQRELEALQVMKGLRHQNLLSLQAFFPLPDRLIIVLELADGSLRGRFVQCREAGQPGIPPAELLRYFREAAEALDYLHEQQVQHRDIKPDNLLLLGRHIKVADFGLARLLEKSSLQSASHAGTPVYMAPEVWNSKLSVHSDQYSLAIMYAELRTGRFPFAYDSLPSLMKAHLMDTPDLTPLGPHEQQVLLRALAKDPAQRHPSCTAFVKALVEALMAEAATSTEPRRTAKRSTAPRSTETQRPAQKQTVVPPAAAPSSKKTQHPPRQQTAKPPAMAPSSTETRRPTEQQTAVPPAVAPPVPPVLSKTEPVHPVETPPVRRRRQPWLVWLIPLATLAVFVIVTSLILRGLIFGNRNKISNSIGIRLVLIPAGTSTMGSPKSEAGRNGDEGQHEVEITKPFFLGACEVTQGQYKEVMGRNPSHFSPTGGGKDEVQGLDTDSFPVEMVSWKDAVEFCDRLSARPAEKEAGRVYRLPTEAEWEYACRGGAAVPYTVFHFGNSLSSRQANVTAPYGVATQGEFLDRTAKGGSYEPNKFGLYDMHGNIWEWCHDWYDPNYYKHSPRQDPQGPRNGTVRVLRGGTWGQPCVFCRAAIRGAHPPDAHRQFYGFRVACVVPSSTRKPADGPSGNFEPGKPASIPTDPVRRPEPKVPAEPDKQAPEPKAPAGKDPEPERSQPDVKVLTALQKNCALCHTGPRSKGKFQLFTSPGVLNPGPAKDKMAAVLNSGKMPPKNRPRPSQDDLAAILGWANAKN